jgi:hypothetical protein
MPSSLRLAPRLCASAVALLVAARGCAALSAHSALQLNLEVKKGARLMKTLLQSTGPYHPITREMPTLAA